MLDHINLPVADLTRSANFYRRLLPVLDMELLYEDAFVVGFGRNKWDFGVELEQMAIPSIHIAFAAQSQRAVQNFYETALDCGAIDNGAPGLRVEFGPSYFAAYILDFDGHNIEAVFRG